MGSVLHTDHPRASCGVGESTSGDGPGGMLALTSLQDEPQPLTGEERLLAGTTTVTLLDARPSWPLGRALITNGQAWGVVTTSRTACADTSPSDPRLVQWLAGQSAFLSEADPAVEGAA